MACTCAKKCLGGHLHCRDHPAKTAFFPLAASEKNSLGRVLKYTPGGNFYLPCQREKILFSRTLPARAGGFRLAKAASADGDNVTPQAAKQGQPRFWRAK